MSQSNESKGPSILFLATIWALSELPVIGPYDILIAIALMITGALAVRMVSQSIYRLGGKAWWLLIQLAICCAVFLYLAPPGLWWKLFILWSCGVPLLLAGAIGRAIYERVPRLHLHAKLVPPILVGVTLVVAPVVTWNAGGGFLNGVLAGLLICGLSGILLYYGWRFAAPLPRAHDAGFGSAESYRAAGMSDER